MQFKRWRVEQAYNGSLCYRCSWGISYGGSSFHGKHCPEKASKIPSFIKRSSIRIFKPNSKRLNIRASLNAFISRREGRCCNQAKILCMENWFNGNQTILDHLVRGLDQNIFGVIDSKAIAASRKWKNGQGPHDSSHGRQIQDGCCVWCRPCYLRR